MFQAKGAVDIDRAIFRYTAVFSIFDRRPASLFRV